MREVYISRVPRNMH